MSVQAVRAARALREELPYVAWQVFMAMAYLADEDGAVQVSDEKLTETVNMLIGIGFFEWEYEVEP